jgi:hypothetical protein
MRRCLQDRLRRFGPLLLDDGAVLPERKRRPRLQGRTLHLICPGRDAGPGAPGLSGVCHLAGVLTSSPASEGSASMDGERFDRFAQRFFDRRSRRSAVLQLVAAFLVVGLVSRDSAQTKKKRPCGDAGQRCCRGKQKCTSGAVCNTFGFCKCKRGRRECGGKCISKPTCNGCQKVECKNGELKCVDVVKGNPCGEVCCSSTENQVCCDSPGVPGGKACIPRDPQCGNVNCMVSCGTIPAVCCESDEICCTVGGMNTCCPV